MKSFKILTILLLVSFILCSQVLADQENKNIILKVNGDVFVLKKGDFRKSFANVNQTLKIGDVVITGAKSSAVLKLHDKSDVIVDENSKLKIEDKNIVEQEEGKAYFNIEKKEQKGFKVKTPFAVIGVKGTEFIINADKNNKSVALKEGLIDVESLNKEFELHREKELSAFEAFMKKTKSAFGKYKEEDKKGFIEYVTKFELQPDKMVTFSKNIAKEQELSEELEKEFKNFRDMI